jgi:phage tail sheath protein FI
LSDELDRGITVTEIAAMDQPIDVATETTAAFVGRALRGPLDTPVLIDSYAAFCRRFGGTWQRSSLGPAVQQFFEHGGSRLFVVRVANSARGAMICLPAVGGVLVLRAVEPGSTEHIRAAVDYDRIEPGDEDRFNLTVQRISPDTGLVADQEIFRRVTCKEGERDFVEDALLSSTLIRAQIPLPAGRPAATKESYAEHAQRGNDGAQLSDYDLVGSATGGSGIFALNEIDRIDLLYLPPPGLDQVPGPAAVLAAELYCRKRGAMLILDPPVEWTDTQGAIDGIKNVGYASSNIIAYYPRIVSRRSKGAAARVAGGAIAGLLCKLDKSRGPWEDLDQRGFGFKRHIDPAVDIDVDDARTLVREGLNVIAGSSAGQATLCGSVTLARDGQMERNFFSLTSRRLSLAITTTIEQAIRWAVFEVDTIPVAARIESQIHAYMCSMADSGAFADDNFIVQCDAGLHAHPAGSEHGITVLLAFRPADSDELVSLTLHQTASRCRVATTAFAPVTTECA